MAKTTKTTRTRNTAVQKTKEKTADNGIVTSRTKTKSVSRTRTPVETYKGEPGKGAKETEDIGDIDEEELDRHAPFNKTYGLNDGTQS